MSGSFGGRLAHSLERFAAKWEPAHWTKPRRGEPLIIQGSSPRPAQGADRARRPDVRGHGQQGRQSGGAAPRRWSPLSLRCARETVARARPVAIHPVIAELGLVAMTSWAAGESGFLSSSDERAPTPFVAWAI